MKLIKKATPAMDFTWLPPAEEWDFRSVTKRECRVACHWEYSRQARLFMAQLPNGQNHCPSNYRGAARELFPQLWTTLTKAQREQVLKSFSPAPALQVHKLGDFLKRVTVSGVSSEIPANFLEYAYVIIPSFTGHGVVAVTRQLGKWASAESKQYPPSPKAQAADLPFDALKWLAVLRIDEARRQAAVTIKKARDTVEAYGLQHAFNHHGDVFPNYSSDGGWSKARTDALKCQTQARTNPAYLLAELV
jgi:hypothetical protein